MPETREELLDRIRSGTIIHCVTAEGTRAVLSFCREMGERLYKYTEEWLDSNWMQDRAYQNVGYDEESGRVLRYGSRSLLVRPSLEFEDIAPILRDESQQDYEIDAAVFDTLFS